MYFFSTWRLFPKIATGILVVFMGLMVLVTIMAYMRPSGSTRQDMSKAQQLRQNAIISSEEADQ